MTPTIATMTWGNYARHLEGDVPEVAAARLGKGASPASPTGARRPGSPPVQAILDLQRTAGNAAVTRLLRPRPVGAPAAPIAQRQDEEYEDGGQSWATDEEAASSSYSADDYSSGETYGPPPPPDWGEGGGQGGTAGEEAPAGESQPAGDAGSQWSTGGGGGDAAGGGAGGGASGGGGGEAPADESGSWWPFGGGEEEPSEEAPSGDEGGSSWWPFGGGGEEAPAEDEGGGSSWWPFGGGEETPAGDDGGGSSWWPFGGDEETPAEPGEEAGEHTQEEMDRKIAEGESGRESDVFVPMSGGPNPVSVADLGGFHDDGQTAIVPFGPRGAGEDSAEALHPRAFVPGGSTGTVTWAGGGGEGKGPKGNQDSGSFQKETVPDYDYNWGGPATNASAFVVSGTGVVDVHRNFVTSAAGDQGNGWWVSPRAAGALTAHEQKHVTRSKGVYDSTIQPMLDKIAKSASYGREITYWGSDAKELVRRYIDWPRTLEKFKSNDQDENAPNNRVDNEDIGSAHYPFSWPGPKTIEGKEYKTYTTMQGEQPPP